MYLKMFLPTDGFPPDGTPVDITHTYQIWLVVVYYILALCGVVVSTVCFAFTFIFRKRR